MEKKKILFVSIDALISDIAWQVVKEGHEAKYYIHNSEYREVADGFVEKVDDWKKWVEWADLIVFDDVLGQGAKAKKLREQGNVIPIHKSVVADFLTPVKMRVDADGVFSF